MRNAWLVIGISVLRSSKFEMRNAWLVVGISVGAKAPKAKPKAKSKAKPKAKAGPLGVGRAPKSPGEWDPLDLDSE